MTCNVHISEELNTFAVAGKKERRRREFSDEGYDDDSCGGGGGGITSTTNTSMAAKTELTCEGSDSGVESTVGGCRRCRTNEGGDSETEGGYVIGSSNEHHSPAYRNVDATTAVELATSTRKLSLCEVETNGVVEGAHSSTASYDGASENGSESSSLDDTKRIAIGVKASGCGDGGSGAVVGSPSKLCSLYGNACKNSRKSSSMMFSSTSSSSSSSRLKVPFTGDALRFGSPKTTVVKMPPFDYEIKSRCGSSSSEAKCGGGRSLRSCSMTRSRTPTVSPDEPSSAKWTATESRTSSRSRLTHSGNGATATMGEKVCTFEAYATLPRRKQQKDGDTKTNSPREPSLNRAASLRKKFLENSLMTTSFNGSYSSSSSLASPQPSYVKTMPSYVKLKPPSKTKIYLEATTQTALTNSDVDHALSDHPFQLFNNLEIQEDAEYRIKKYYEEQMTCCNDELKKLKKENCKQRTVIEWLESELATQKDEKFTAQNRLTTVEQKIYSLLRHKSSGSDDILHQLEREATYSNNVISQQQEEIAALQQMYSILKKDLEKSYSTHKAAEAESMEMEEFLQAEKSTLTDSLRDTELELKTCQARLTETQQKLTEKIGELTNVQTTCEELRKEKTASNARLCNLERRCRELLLHQGAAISSASVALLGLGSRFEQLLELLVSNYDLSDNDLQDESQENQFSNDENGTNCNNTGNDEEVVRRKASRKWLKAIGSAISKTFAEKQDRNLGTTDLSNGPSPVILKKNSRLKNVTSTSFDEDTADDSIDDDKRRESTFNLISTCNDDPLSLLKLEADSRRSSMLTEVYAGVDNLPLDFGTNDELPLDTTTDIKRDLLKDYSTQEVSLVEQINEIDNLITKAFKAILLTQTTTGTVPKEKSQFETADASGEVAGETKRSDSIGSVSKFANKLVRLMKENGKTVPNGQCVPNKNDNNETIAYLRMQQKAIKNTLGMLHKMPETVNESVFLKRIQSDLENVNQICETYLSTANNEVTK